jgi:mRNA interferase RelE/StbE
LAPVWRVEFDRDAAREFRKLGEPARRAILKYLRERIATSENPRRFGKPLLGDMKGLWRYRVGDCRIVAKIKDRRLLVLVVTVGNRRDVYD